MSKIKQASNSFIITIILSIASCGVMAQVGKDVSLIGIETRATSNNKAQMLLQFDGTPPTPTAFSMGNPAAMIFDFAAVNNNLKQEQVKQKISLGIMRSYSVIDSGDTVRLIVNVLNVVPYTIDADRNCIVITLDNDADLQVTDSNIYTIAGLDFRRGEQGEGRVIIDFSNDLVPIDFDERTNEIVVQFQGATIAENLLRRYDVSDFGTNISTVTLEKKDQGVRMTINATGSYEKLAYQLDKQYVVEVRPLSEAALSELKVQKFQFTGERISLNFQDIPIRAVLQLIADFTGLNIVISDTVTGNVTLRLEEIPWDQALDFILKSKGLAKRESGDVMLIAPSEELAAREQLDLESQQQVQSLEPLRTEYIQVNFAKSADLLTIIKDANNSLLSERGQISEDPRTNTLLIKDIQENIVNIRLLVERLDIPIRQVMIETQIVETTDTLTHALGIRMNGAATPQLGKYTLGVSPSMALAQEFSQNKASKVYSSADNAGEGRMFVDFAGVALGHLGLALGRLPGGTLLSLELDASETEALSKTVARPKLLTLDQQTAVIETGTEIPYVTVSQDGATPTTTFKNALLRLEVTPQITPNNKISMLLDINNDTPGPVQNEEAGPSINTTKITTNVLVDNGETIVLGGIFKLQDSKTKNSIPYFHRIPVIGQLFSRNTALSQRTEILIFVTPRIMQNIMEQD